MSKNYHRFPIPGSCASSNFAIADFCLPLKQDCSVNEDDFLGETAPWSIEPCNDPTYCNPVQVGDVLNFQTQFPGSDPDNPSFGLTGELFDGAGNSLSTELGEFGGSGCAGFNGDNFFQNTSINTSAVAGFTGGNRFSLEISDGNSVLSSQCYMFVDDEECNLATHVLRGEYDSKDCFERSSVEGCEFSPSIRLYSDIVDIGGGITKTYFGERVVGNLMEWDYVLALTKPVPYFIKNTILVILNADRVFIDEQEVRIPESFRIANKIKNDSGSIRTQFMFDIPFQFRCDRKGIC